MRSGSGFGSDPSCGKIDGLKEINRITIPLNYPVHTLNWEGDELVDWVGGGRRFSLGKSIRESNVHYAYRFDRAAVISGGEFVVLYEALGTKGLILRDGKLLREINRSFYHADAYEYPVALFHLPDGTPAIAHCPNEYNELEIDELISGKRLTTRSSKAVDFFHSRLQISPDGAYLLSAGWVWNPLDAVQTFAIREALNDPSCLDRHTGLELPPKLFEMHSACFGAAHELLYSAKEDSKDATPHLVRIDLRVRKTISFTPLKGIPGTMTAIGPDYVLGFYDHPKLFDATSGEIVVSWPELKTGRQDSSIIHHIEAIPPFAVDAQKKRFAVADQASITVIELG